LETLYYEMEYTVQFGSYLKENSSHHHYQYKLVKEAFEELCILRKVS